MIEFSANFLELLSGEAQRAPRLRRHHNIHDGPLDPCQRFFNAIEEDSYVRPHRHQLDPRRELIVAVRGSFAVVTFEDSGDISTAVRIAAERFGKDSVGVEVGPEDWHTVIALEPRSVLLEVKAGPYVASAAKEFACWSPEEGGPAASAYLGLLSARVRAMLDAAYGHP